MDDIEELYHLFPSIKNDIKVIKKVGQGTFSYVYLAHLIDDETERFALKYIIPTSSPARTKQEIDCLLKIGGQNNVIGINAVLRTKSHILIIMPYLDHVSFHESYLQWSAEEIKQYIKNLLISLDRVHKFNIIHRDVKPSNFLYCRNKKQYALVDFGLAQPFEKSVLPAPHALHNNDENKLTIISGNRQASIATSFTGSPISVPNKKQSLTKNAKSSSPNIMPNNKSPLTNTFQKYYSFHKTSYNLSSLDMRNSNNCTCFNMPFVCDICTSKNAKWAPRAGTSGFRAPEVLLRYTNQTTSVDIWSAGVVFLCLLSGRYPFFKATDDNMAIMQLITVFGTDSMRKIAVKYGETLICDVERIGFDLKNLCKSLRSSAAFNFPDSAYDLLKGLLELDFEKRLTAEQALNHEFFYSN